MEYRNVGKTGLKVSTISIGGWVTMGGTIDDKRSHEITRQAIDSGINFIDLADVYARGEAERVVGEILGDYKRSDLVISSKVFWPMSDAPNDRGLSRKHIMESVEKSLKRLNTDYLDLYFCHRWDENTPIDETVRAMDDLVTQGKILYWGTSVWEADQLKAAHQSAEKFGAYAPVVEQPRYNLLDRSIEPEIAPMCAELGMGLVVWSPLAQGLLAGRYNDGVPEDSRAATTNWLSDTLTDENIARANAFTTVAEEFGCTPGQLALAWCLLRPEVASVITGASRAEHVASNVAAAELKLTDDVIAAVEDIFS